MIALRNHLLPAAALAAVLVLAACSNRVAGDGDATETGNALAGTLVIEGGGAAAGARVLLVPEDHNPVSAPALPDSMMATTDGKGRFGIKHARPGRYNVQALHPSTGRRALIQGVVIAAEPVKLARDSVRAPGSLSFILPDWAGKEGGTLYVPGTTYKVKVEQARREGDRVLFDSLPVGMLPEVRYVSGGTDTASILLASDPVVRMGVLAPIHPFAAWSHSARILVNTTAAGVAIEKEILGFPLLVRLTAPAFDFTQAQADGRDLRFAKPDGSSLPFAIEAWERGGVLVWVRVDTLHAGESGQYLTAHWGNGQASLPLGMAPVFDTAAGFAGAWHLREEAADTVTDGLYKDATQAGNDGNDRVTSKVHPGVVGAGHSFALGDYIQAPSASDAVRLPGGFTLSTWFRSQLQAGRKGGELISVGDNYGLRLGENGRLHVFFWPAIAPPGSQNPWYTVGSQGADFLDGNWHLAQGTFDGSMLRLYLDGRELAALAVPGPVDFKFDLNVTLGRHGAGQSGFDYTGELDEVQIHSKPRNADWHRMTFENQRPGSGFPVLAPP